MAHMLLPKLRENPNIMIPENDCGKWVDSAQNSIQNLIKDLDVHERGSAAAISAIPDMWARPLLFEMALFDQNHLLHRKTVGEWRGLLAVLALKSIRNFECITIKKVNIPAIRDISRTNGDVPLFVKTLAKLLPQNTLGGGLSWNEIYVILNYGKPLGIVSPSTLVCTAGDCLNKMYPIPWTDGQVLTDPVERLNRQEREWLGSWLDKILQSILPLAGHGGACANNLVRLFRNESGIASGKGGFLDALGIPLSATPGQISYDDTTQLIGSSLLAALNPIKAEAGEFRSDVLLQASNGKNPKVKLLVVDQRIAEQWGLAPQDVVVVNHAPLSSIPFGGVLDTFSFSGVPLSPFNAEIRTPQSLFLPKLYLVEKEYAFPGAITSFRVNYRQKAMTAILPIHQDLLSYFTPVDFAKRVKIEAMAEGIVRVQIDLPMVNGKSFKIEQSYNGNSGEIILLNAADEVPVLEIWPNFSAESWHAYYTYCDRDIYDTAFFATPYPSTDSAETRVIHQHKGKPVGQITKTKVFPEAMLCNVESEGLGVPIGFIPLEQPEKVTQKEKTWKIGVDFGTTNTNVYVAEDEKVSRMHLSNRLFQVCASEVTKRQSLVDGNFLSVFNEIPVPFLSYYDIPLERLQSRPSVGGERAPFFDGHIFFYPGYNRFDAGAEGLHFNLKWGGPEERACEKLLLTQLAMQCSAEAAAKGVKKIDWRFSFPTSFSNQDAAQLDTIWNKISIDIAEITGISREGDFRNPPLRKSESVAAAHFFAEGDLRATFIRGVVCMDIGGGTTDVSIWQDQNFSLRLQTSLRYAGRDMFLRLLQKCPGFLKKFVDNTDILANFKQDEKKFIAQLDALLKERGRMMLDKLTEHAGEREVKEFVSLVSLGLSGIFYYIGILLADLNIRGQYDNKDGLPNIYIGGNGVHLFHWASFGQYRENVPAAKLFQDMLWNGVADYARAARREPAFTQDYVPAIKLSEVPKEEVGFGLVSDRTPLSYTKMQGKFESVGCLAGIEFLEAGSLRDGASLVTAEGIKRGLQLSPDTTEFKAFLDKFNEAAKEANVSKVEYDERLLKNVRDQVNEDLARLKSRDINDLAAEPIFILMLKAFLAQKADVWAQNCPLM